MEDPVPEREAEWQLVRRGLLLLSWCSAVSVVLSGRLLLVATDFHWIAVVCIAHAALVWTMRALVVWRNAPQRGRGEATVPRAGPALAMLAGGWLSWLILGALLFDRLGMP